jgi:hypothetical protein
MLLSVDGKGDLIVHVLFPVNRRWLSRASACLARIETTSKQINFCYKILSEIFGFDTSRKEHAGLLNQRRMDEILFRS